MQFKVLHFTPSSNWLLAPIEHKEPISKKLQVAIQGKRVGFIFDTIARVKKPFYLAKLQGKNLEGKIVECL